MKPLSNKDKKKIIKKLNIQFGITNIPYLILQFGHDKFRLYSGNLSKEELALLDRSIKIENIGLYFAKQEKDGIKLTLDSLTLFKTQITKNIIELTENQKNSWLEGKDLDIKTNSGYKILKFNNEFIGCGKSDKTRICNSIPKERRIKF